MHELTISERYYLYDKSKGVYTKIFYSLHELKAFLRERIEDTNLLQRGSRHPYNLSMSLSLTEMTQSQSFRRWDEDEQDFIYYSGNVNVPVNTEVIITSSGNIFNYTELCDELYFTLGQTEYDKFYQPVKIKRTSSYGNYQVGHKRHNRGSGSFSLIIPINTQAKFCSARTEASDIVNEAYENHIDVSYEMVHKALTKRPNTLKRRSGFYEEDYCSHYDNVNYGSPSSWKNQKKTRQWMRGKCKDRVTNKYLNPKAIDENFLYLKEDMTNE